jgi:hypothetical protein
MGAYLSSPITTKESSDGEGKIVRFGASAMQGWRMHMEVRAEWSRLFCPGTIEAVLRLHALFMVFTQIALKCTPRLRRMPCATCRCFDCFTENTWSQCVELLIAANFTGISSFRTM